MTDTSIVQSNPPTVENPAQPGATGGPITDAVENAEKFVQAVEPIANGVVDQVGGAELLKRVQAIEATIAGWEPVVNELMGVGEAAAREGHSVGSIITAIGQKLLGIMHP